MSDISWDFSELDRLTADLGEVPKKAGTNMRKAVEVGARHVKDDWKESSSGLPHAPDFPASIGYDILRFQGFGVSIIQADIGPDKNRAQGALGNLIEYGSVNNPPMGLGHGALFREQEDFVKGIEMAEEAARKDNNL